MLAVRQKGGGEAMTDSDEIFELRKQLRELVAAVDVLPNGQWPWVDESVERARKSLGHGPCACGQRFSNAKSHSKSVCVV